MPIGEPNLPVPASKCWIPDCDNPVWIPHLGLCGDHTCPACMCRPVLNYEDNHKICEPCKQLRQLRQEVEDARDFVAQGIAGVLQKLSAMEVK